MIIYKTINIINGKIYVGQHTKNNPGYIGSGRVILKAIKNTERITLQEKSLKNVLTKLS
jgi:hypothetical protein